MANDQKISHGAEGVRWDLSDLYASLEDPKIEQDLKEIDRRAQSFETSYRLNINVKTLKDNTLLEAVQELEAISEKAGRILSFASLVFSSDSEESKNGSFLQKMRERITQIRKHLIFFSVEWLLLPEKQIEILLKSPKLNHYRHFLEYERRYKPHHLSEPEEKILEEKANTGVKSFERLFEEILNAIRFPFECRGEKKELSEQETLALLHHKDRETRKAAGDALTQGLKSNKKVLNFIFNVIVADHASNDRLRSFPTPMSSRHLSNEIDPKAVDALLTSCEKHFHLVNRYYHLKKRLLGLDRLFDYDRYAPLFQEDQTFDFSQCREIVLSAFEEFSPQMSDIASLFFKNHWIDAELRPGKSGGAFSHGTVPSIHPYILVNYSGRRRDVMTVAHELGHGVHQYLSRPRGYLQSDTPLTTAETASVFAEMLVFQKLKKNETEPKERLSLICGKLEDTFATVFRQVVMTRFEQRLHDARREEGELPDSRVNKLWLETNQKMFGDSITLREDYGWWWMYISHFVHSPFYCYAYAFGELLVLTLFNRYLNEGQAFTSKYIDLLSAGGSDHPENLLAHVGVDITAPNFWNGGLEFVQKMVEEAEDLALQSGF